MTMDMTECNIIGISPRVWDTLWRINIGEIDIDINHFLDSMSPNQIESKKWLVEVVELILSDKKDIKVQLFGGWLGFPLSGFLAQNLDIKVIENIDIDPTAIKIYRYWTRNDKKYITNLSDKIQFDSHIRDVSTPGKRDKDIHLVINTSSEHMKSLPEIINDKKYRQDCLFALQSNNMFHIDDHINCVNDEDELVEKSGLSNIMYKGSLDMPNGYKRFMVIGYV